MAHWALSLSGIASEPQDEGHSSLPNVANRIAGDLWSDGGTLR